MIAAYREPDQKHGKAMMQAVIDSVASGVPATLTEIRKLGPTLKQRATDILAVFDRPGTSNGPTEAINGRLKHLVGSAGPTLTLRPCVGAGQLTWSGCCWVTGGRAPSVPRRDRWSAKSPAVSAPAPSHQPGTPGPGAGGLAQLHRVGSSGRWSLTMAKAIRLARFAMALAITPGGLARARGEAASARAAGSSRHRPTRASARPAAG